jgi:hypothetical protein
VQKECGDSWHAQSRVPVLLQNLTVTHGKPLLSLFLLVFCADSWCKHKAQFINITNKDKCHRKKNDVRCFFFWESASGFGIERQFYMPRKLHNFLHTLNFLTNLVPPAFVFQSRTATTSPDARIPGKEASAACSDLLVQWEHRSQGSMFLVLVASHAVQIRAGTVSIQQGNPASSRVAECHQKSNSS